MPLLVLLPLLVVCIVALVLALLPVSLWQRYRRGHSRRRAQGWVVGVGAWSALLALGLFAVSTAVAGVWVPDAAVHAVGGLAAGGVLGGVGLALTRFESADGQLHYTPNRVLVGLLTALVAARIAVSLWQAAHVAGPASTAWWLQPATLFASGGALLGYAVAYAWGVRARLRRVQA